MDSSVGRMQSLHIVEIIGDGPHLHHALSVISCQSLYLCPATTCQFSDAESLDAILTGFETILALVGGSGLGFLEKVVLGALHRDEPVLQIHSSRNGFVDE
jgi:hypothetical protein